MCLALVSLNILPQTARFLPEAIWRQDRSKMQSYRIVNSFHIKLLCHTFLLLPELKKNLKIHIWKKNFKTESSTLTTALESTTKSSLPLWSHPDRKVTTREPFLKWLHCLRLSIQPKLPGVPAGLGSGSAGSPWVYKYQLQCLPSWRLGLGVSSKTWRSSRSKGKDVTETCKCL